MVVVVSNPFRGTGVDPDALAPSHNAKAVEKLLSLCPLHARTPLHDMPDLAARAGVAKLWVKDERPRMGLGSFKALGAAYAIARQAAEAVQDDAWDRALAGRVFVTASAGNHGLSVAAGANVFGAKAVIFLADTVPEAFALRLRAKGTQVERAGANYEQSMEAAAQWTQDRGYTLLSDSSWPGYTALPYDVMEGYLQLAAEAAEQINEAPSHVLLQAGVGGLAGAVAAYARSVWGDVPEIIVLEPEAAPALLESIRAGKVVESQGPVSAMGRLDCKTPSMIAFAGLARDANYFATLTEDEAARGVAELVAYDLATTPSGGACLAALLAGIPSIGADARVFVILSEGPEDD